MNFCTLCFLVISTEHRGGEIYLGQLVSLIDFSRKPALSIAEVLEMTN